MQFLGNLRDAKDFLIEGRGMLTQIQDIGQGLHGLNDAAAELVNSLYWPGTTDPNSVIDFGQPGVTGSGSTLDTGVTATQGAANATVSNSVAANIPVGTEGATVGTTVSDAAAAAQNALTNAAGAIGSTASTITTIAIIGAIGFLLMEASNFNRGR